MTMRTTAGRIAILFAALCAPSRALAGEADDDKPTPSATSGLAIDQRMMLGGGIFGGTFTRPAAFPGAKTSNFAALDLHLRIAEEAATAEPKRSTSVQTGFEGALMLNLGGESDRATGDRRAPVALTGSAGVYVRPVAWNKPFLGAMVFHVNAELGVGGTSYWSDSLRFAPMGGVRFTSAFGTVLRLELDYTLVPTIFTSSPFGMDVDRTEHRALATLGFGPFGVGVRFTRWQSLVYHPSFGEQRNDGTQSGFFLEARLR